MAIQKDLFVEGLRLLLNSATAERAAAKDEHERMVHAAGIAAQRVRGLDQKIIHIKAAIEQMDLTTGQAGALPILPLPALPPLNPECSDAAAADAAPADAGSSDATSARKWREDIVRRVENMLTGGFQLSTSAIYTELIRQNINFRDLKNPQHRLVQILSTHPQFLSDRRNGWSLSGLSFPSILEMVAKSDSHAMAAQPVNKEDSDDEL